ncbi:methyl-CpG-binding domain-containing protein 7-like [Chenopodium quinoa]|uniref:MBD domain-containing protein n=1 Tax=Chenopodium quinoa TaxID=63459 RepID=A0A803LCN4_CHEQI|nr:methyl-CpG-binding domain-containing protein 7-like [Chenopodium quinoa]
MRSPPKSPATMSAQPEPIEVIRAGKRPEMRLVPILPNIPEFELPDGWVVEVRPRGPTSSIKMSDKYYYEPGTGRKFRSLISVQRYLSGVEHVVVPRSKPSNKQPSNSLVPYQHSGTVRRIVYGGKVLRPDELEEARLAKLDDIVPETFQPKSSSILPDGWIVEEIPRKCGTRCDRYYIEPRNGQRFRSVPEVQKYLASHKYSSKSKALTLKNHSTAPRSPAPRKKNTSLKTFKTSMFRTFRTSIIDLTNPPEKINWVYSGDGTDNWSPLVEECMLPDYIKEQWEETFLLGMNGWKHRVPQLTMGESLQATNA